MAEEYRLKTMKTTGPKPSPLYNKKPVIIQVPYLQRISPNPYLSIKPSTLKTPCDFFHLSLYRWSLSRSLQIILTVHLLYSFLIFTMHHPLSHCPFILIIPLVHPFLTVHPLSRACLTT